MASTGISGRRKRALSHWPKRKAAWQARWRRPWPTPGKRCARFARGTSRPARRTRAALLTVRQPASAGTIRRGATDGYDRPCYDSFRSATAQQAAALARGGDVAVTAGAGTGKTRTLVARYLDLLADGLPLRQIVAITFTRKAAREMRNRVRQEVGRYLADAAPGRCRKREMAGALQRVGRRAHRHDPQLLRRHSTQPPGRGRHRSPIRRAGRNPDGAAAPGSGGNGPGLGGGVGRTACPFQPALREQAARSNHRPAQAAGSGRRGAAEAAGGRDACALGGHAGSGPGGGHRAPVCRPRIHRRTRNAAAQPGAQPRRQTSVSAAVGLKRFRYRGRSAAG